MITLPFKLNVTFDFSDTQDFNLQIFANLVSEIQNITPAAEITIYISNTNIIPMVQSFFADCQYEICFLFSGNLKLQNDFCYENYNLQCYLHEVQNLYSVLNINKYLKFKNLIVKHSATNLSNDTYNECINFLDKFRNIIKHKIFLQPYLTENETKNYYCPKTCNRNFLTCAAPWLSPIIYSNGDVCICKNKKIGNLSENSFWNIWNSEKINIIRSELLKSKYCKYSNNCNLFYKDSFLIVDNKKLIYKNITFEFDSEINYIPSAPKILITENKKINDNHYLADICPVFSDDNLADICNKKNVLLILE